jgi:hypothetical protein
MTIFIPVEVIPYEGDTTMGVYASLSEALAKRPDEVHEYVIGSDRAIREYDETGKMFWEDPDQVIKQQELGN